MQDPRALANTRNLQSYRAWEQEGYWRSGFLVIVMSIPVVLAPTFIFGIHLALPLFRHAARDFHSWKLVVGVAGVIYLAVAAWLLVFSAMRLNAWKLAHAWAPPSPKEKGRSFDRPSHS